MFIKKIIKEVEIGSTTKEKKKFGRVRLPKYFGNKVFQITVFRVNDLEWEKGEILEKKSDPYGVIHFSGEFIGKVAYIKIPDEEVISYFKSNFEDIIVESL